MPYSRLVKRFLSFATIGGILTLVSLTANFVCLKYLLMPLLPTYVLVYAVTILISFYFNSRYTFKSEINLRNSVKYYTIYLSSMCIGAFLLVLFEKLSHFENWVYPFLVLPFTLSFNFYVSSRTLSLSKDVT
ncbi:MAG: GtrA family protein [Saprospiraceae bacterium]|nr:GtrA family protein [Saprospiraceae bacterium]